MNIIKNLTRLKGRGETPQKDTAPQGHEYLHLTLPKVKFLPKFINQIRGSRIARRLGRKDESLDVFLPHLEAKTANRLQSVATTTEAEAEVRKASYERKRDRYDRTEEIMADQIRLCDAYKKNETDQLHREHYTKIASTNEKIKRVTSQLDRVQEQLEDLADFLRISPDSAPIRLCARWMIPVLLVIGLADFLGIADALTPLGMTRTNALLMALGTSFTLIYIAHTLGHIVRRHPTFSGVAVAIGTFLVPFYALYHLSKMRAAYLESLGELPVGPDYANTFGFLLLTGFVAGILAGYFGAHPHPAETKAFNQNCRTKADLENQLKALDDSKTQAEEQLHANLATMEERYRNEWRGIMEGLPTKFEAELDTASRDYFHLSVAMRELRKQADAQIQEETALVKTRFVLAGGRLPESGDLKTDKPPLVAKVKAGIVAILLACCFGLGMSGCSLIEDTNQGQTSHVILLHDRTASFALDRAFTDAEILNLSQVDSAAPALWNGGKWEFSVIDGAFVSTTLHDELPPASASNSNLLARKKRVKEWMLGFNYARLIQNAPALSDATNLIDPLSQALHSLEQSASGRKILVVSSDLVHCERGSVCLVDDETFAMIQDDPDEVIEQLERISALPSDLNGIEIILLTHVESSNESQRLRVISKFWSDWLRDRGATVSIRANLPQVW